MKTRLKYILTVWAVLTIIGTSNAQRFNRPKQQGVKPLTVGDTLPDYFVPKVINADKASAKTSDYRDRLLILDFWSTLCVSCIHEMPKMDALQKRFGDRIRILPVTHEPEAKISPFWKNNNYLKNLSLPSVVDDQLFEALFPHEGLPFEVWIYKRKVIGITGPDYVDVANIQRILNGESVDWVVRNDFYKYDQSQYLFKTDHRATKVQHIGVTGYKTGLKYDISAGRGIKRDVEKKLVRTFWLNEPVYNSYIMNWRKVLGMQKLIKPSELGLDSNEVVWEVADRSKYRFHRKFTPYMQEWIRSNAYCFESVYPDKGESDRQVYLRAIADYDRMLGLHVRWEKRKEKVWVLKEKPGYGLPNVKWGKPGEGTTTMGILQTFNNQEDHCYVFNEVKFSDVERWMDIRLDALASLSTVNAAVAVYGLEMIEEERLVDKLVFTEVKMNKQ